MANPSAGSYFLVPANATGKVLDVTGGTLKDGSNVGVYAKNNQDNQIWKLSYRSDGTAQISNRLTGKCADVTGGTLSAGTNVQLWTDNDGRAQKWTLTEKSTVTISGTSYATYEILLTATASLSTKLCMKAGTSNVIVAARADESAQRWAFVPIPAFKSGGVYEIRSKADTTMCADVEGASKANGANVLLWKKNHNNNQKWVIVNEGNGWSVRNVASGKYMDVEGGTIASGKNVCSYQDNDQRNQRWAITTYGTATCDGQTCETVSFGAGNATSFMMDAEGASTSNSTNLIVWASNGGGNQRWYLWPTWAEDEFMPAPYSLGITEGEATADWGSTMTALVHPTWKCAQAYANSGPNGYQIRTRTRKMSATTSTYGSWTDWTAWDTASVTRSGVKSTLTRGVTMSMTNSYKAMQLQFEVRATGVKESSGNYSLLYGASKTYTVTLAPAPGITLSNTKWSAKGLNIAYSAVYPFTSIVYLDEVRLSGRNILKAPIKFTAYDDTTSITVPVDKLFTLPQAGSSITLVYSYGTDVRSRFNGNETSGPHTVINITGGMSVTPTFVMDGYMLKATFPELGNTRVWATSGFDTVECEKISTSNGNSTFAVLFPIGTEYTLFASGYDASSWFAWSANRTEKVPSAHVWNWDGGEALLQVREGTPITTQDVIEAEYQAWLLSARPYETVGFTEGRKHHFTAVGAVAAGTDSNRVDFEVIPGVHALYRSPAGDMVPVAVLSVDRESHVNWTEISVSMARESE